MIEHNPAESRPYKRAGKLLVKGHNMIEAGTFETAWLKRMLHQYSFPATCFLRNAEIPGFAEIDDEKIKKHKKVSRRT